MLTDNIQRLSAEEASQLLVSIVESSDDAIISKDLDGIITSWNKGAERVFGYTANEVIGKPILILIPEELQAEEPTILQKIRRGERIDHYETVRQRKDGSKIDISLTISPIRNGTGQVIGASKIARDVTDLKEAREAARRADQHLRNFVENANVGMHWVGPDGIVLWANRTELEMLGYTEQEYIGHHIEEFHVDQPVIDDILQRLTRGETLTNHEARLRCKDGSILDVEINSTVFWDGDKFLHTRCFTHDVSERKRYEERIAMLGQEAEHRTKNVLATVQAIVQLTKSENTDEFKNAIAGRIQALANVHGLFSETKWARTDLGSLIRQELSPFVGEGKKAFRAQGPVLLLTPDNAQAIAVALHELTTNAAKYGALSVDEGQIDVEWSHAPDKSLVIRWTETGGPPVRPPKRQGFGMRVLDSMIGSQLGGKVQFDWRPKGLSCEIMMPL